MKVFISHSSHDKRIVRTLKDDLNDNGINTWVDEDELNLGDSLIESLDAAIDDTSHFIIILTPNSVKSEWVRIELSKAIEQNKNGLLEKIIPIKLTDCQVPEFLEDLLFGDLSAEMVRRVDQKVEFITDGYKPFLAKLIRAIRNSKKKLLNKADKATVKSSFEVDEKKILAVQFSTINGIYNLLRFRTKSRILSNAEKAKKGKNFDKISKISTEDIRPILLPLSWKFLFKELSIGSKITLQNGLFRNSPFSGIGDSDGFISGFRKSDLAITIDPRIRKNCHLISGKIYQVEFDSNKKIMTFTDI